MVSKIWGKTGHFLLPELKHMAPASEFLSLFFIFSVISFLLTLLQSSRLIKTIQNHVLFNRNKNRLEFQQSDTRWK